MKKLLAFMLAAGTVLSAATSCDLLEQMFPSQGNEENENNEGQKEEEKGDPDAVVVTLVSTDPNFTSIALPFKVNFKAAGSYTSFKAGVCYSVTNENPTIADGFEELHPLNDGTMDMSGNYQLVAGDLEENTKVYYCAYAKFDEKEYYGKVLSVTTKALNISTEQMTDLGLSVKWAGWNVGATKPEEDGNFYAWGETAPHESGSYSSGECDYSSYRNTYKYSLDANVAALGMVDGRYKLMACDDAANVNWGGNWRIPTVAEKRELLQCTERLIYTYKGVKGYVFVSKKNGKSIFFPMAGYMDGSRLLGKDEIVAFWTSQIRNSDNLQAHCACNMIAGSTILKHAGFDMDATGADSYNLSQYRYNGMSVRAVYGSEIPAEKYVVTTLPAENIGANTATVRFTVSGSPSNITSQGVLYTASNGRCVFGVAMYVDSTDYTANLVYMSSKLAYRAAAYIVVDGITYYGNEVSFTTL